MPQVRSELEFWGARADAIPARALREAGQSAMAKRGNIEGAALFATLAPAAQRGGAVRALVAFQTAYNYLDALSEIPTGDPPVANTEMLHQALLLGLHPGVEQIDYYGCYPEDDDDGGFLTDLVQACRTAVDGLPSWVAVGPVARGAAGRIVDFQALNLRESDGGHRALEGWAREATVAEGDTAWWETAAGAGSSLAVHALIAAAGNPGVGIDEARAIEKAYFPSGGALHSLLDSLVDRGEDRALGQRSLLDYYGGPAAAALRLGVLARTAAGATMGVDEAERHRVILVAMCSYYLSAGECYTSEAAMIRRILNGVFGARLSVAVLMFRSKRLLHAFTDPTYS